MSCSITFSWYVMSELKLEGVYTVTRVVQNYSTHFFNLFELSFFVITVGLVRIETFSAQITNHTMAEHFFGTFILNLFYLKYL